MLVATNVLTPNYHINHIYNNNPHLTNLGKGRVLVATNVLTPNPYNNNPHLTDLGKGRVLVATNVLARGIDVEGIDLVVCTSPSFPLCFFLIFLLFLLYIPFFYHLR